MNQGGGTLLIEGNEDWNGAGHPSIYNFSGKDYMFFHAYDANDEGRSKLKIAEVDWDEEAWPQLNQNVLD